MINTTILTDVLTAYKKDFPIKIWADEKYKWEAVKHFQDKWDIKAPDFAAMLKNALSMTFNLLASSYNYPRKMIEQFADVAPEEVRAMFIALFDESKDLYDRVNGFKNQSQELLEKYGNDAKQHFQYEGAITTYLWLHYPDKYYIFKLGEIKAVAEVLESSYQFKKGAYADNIRNGIKLYDEICDELQQDDELIDLFKSHLTDTCYPDTHLRTLTLDISFYISRYYSTVEKNPTDKWFPDFYSPEFSEDDWLELLADSELFTTGSLEIMKRMKDYGGQATCKQLSVKYGETPNFYNGGSVGLAKRIAKKTNCPIMDREDDSSRWWPILYVGRRTVKGEEGAYLWKLRDELSSALDKFDLSQVELYATSSDSGDIAYWWLNANPKIWSFANIAVEDTVSYTLLNDNGNKRRVFQNFLDAKAGDIVICYESNPVKQIVAFGKITAEQDGERICIEKTEGLTSPIDYTLLKNCPELEKMEFFMNPNGTLFKLTPGEYNFIVDIIREENPRPDNDKAEKYAQEDFLDEVYMTEGTYTMLVSVLKNKKNVILKGAPGVGKTFSAKRLAYSIMGVKDDSRIEFVQFHQNYSYEDFVMGYKPVDDGFELRTGVFYRFCQIAANQPDKEFFFIIDEINRGNVSKIFGELLMLIESDYRGHKVTLAYNGIPFSVPKNLYIIGMMNTADRSLAMIDYALRRRFSFFDIEPGFDSAGFTKYKDSLNDETFNELVSVIKNLNNDITMDKSLGKGFCIGHSYLCGQDSCTEDWLRAVVEYDIIPLISEYWFDNESKLQQWENQLRGIFND